MNGTKQRPSGPAWDLLETGVPEQVEAKRAAVEEQFRLLRSLRLAAAGCAVVVVAIAFVALFGLFTGNFLLASIKPGYKVMDPAFALILLLLGGGIMVLALVRKVPHRFLQAAAVLAVVISVARLAELAAGANWGLSDLFLPASLLPGSSDQAPMSFAATVAALAAGLWLLLVALRSGRLQTLVPAAITAIIGAAFFLGYVYGKPLLYGPGLLPVSLPGAVSLTLLGAGMIIISAALEAALHRLTDAQLREYRDRLESLVEQRTAALAAYQRRLRRLAAEVTTAQQRERQRLASAIHDEIAQMLGVIKLYLSGLRAQETDPARVEKIAAIINMVDEATKQSRTIMMELSPLILQQGGLSAAVPWWAGEIKQKHGLDVAISVPDTIGRFDTDVEATVFEGMKELLHNTIKYAKATQVAVSVTCHDKQLQVEVRDNGIGFDPEAVERTESGGFGLFGIRERVSYIQGSLTIASAPGQGTHATIIVPATCPSLPS
jgi:signal transduction histidine kinase